MYGEVREIHISTECYTSHHSLPSLMRQFHPQYPNVKIVMYAIHEPLQKIIEDALDIALSIDPVKDENIS